MARKQHTAVWTGTEMVVYGGTTSETAAAATGAGYDPVLNHWRALGNPGNPVARTAATAVWTGSQMLFFGGSSASGVPLAALQRLDAQPDWYFFRKP